MIFTKLTHTVLSVTFSDTDEYTFKAKVNIKSAQSLQLTLKFSIQSKSSMDLTVNYNDSPYFHKLFR